MCLPASESLQDRVGTVGCLKEPDGIGGPENTGVPVTQPVPFPGGPGEGSG